MAPRRLHAPSRYRHLVCGPLRPVEPATAATTAASSAQRPRSRLLASIGRILRQREPAQHAAVTHLQSPPRTVTAHAQHLNPLPEQRMERMRDHQRIGTTVT
jgi:hypothetical protein